MSDLVRTTVRIWKKQLAWIKKSEHALSKMVRKHIDDEMAKAGNNDV